MRIPRIHLTFVCSADGLDEDSHPPGERLADDIVEFLSSLGTLNDAIANWRDFGWSWNCCLPGGERNCVNFCLSAMYPLQQRRWLLDAGIKGAWRIWRRQLQLEFIRHLAFGLNDLLHSNSRISDVRWYHHKPAFSPNAEWEKSPSF